MAARLKIGDTIIDAARSASTSTISGAVLMFPAGSFETDEDDVSSTFDVHVYFSGLATKAACSAAVKALKQAVADATHRDVVVETEPDVERRSWKVSDGSYTQIVGRVRTRWGGKTAFCTLTIRAERTAPPAPGGGALPAGATGAVVQHEMTVSGLAATVITYNFETRAAAMTYLNTLRSTPPAFLGPNFRLVHVTPPFEIQPTDESPPTDNSFKPAQLSVAYKELSENWAGNAAFEDVKICVPTFNANARELQANTGVSAGQQPGFTISLGLLLEFKTEGNTTFDSNDTQQVAENALRQKADDCLDVVKAAAETRLDEGPFVEIGPRDYRINLEHGTVEVSLTAVTGNTNRVLKVEDRTTVEFQDRSLKVYSSRPGSRPRSFGHPGGRRIIVRQALMIEAIGAARSPYKPFGMGNKYTENSRSVDVVPIISTQGSDVSRFITVATGEWEADEAANPGTPNIPGGVTQPGAPGQ